MPIIEVKDLTKKYDKLTAVNGINLQINEGEIFGLLGPNGAGKTTTLMMLSTLLEPTSGKAIVNGFDVKKNPSKVRHSIGFVFQDPSSDDLLTGRENLYLHGLMFGVDMKTINQKMDEVLALVDLSDRQHARMKTYSGGMRRRLELARGLLHEPKILFLDEPTLGLDPQTREHIWTYIKRLSREKKVTIIITTHYMEEADSLCDRIAIIDNGKIVALDTSHNLKKKLGNDIITLQIKNPNILQIKKLSFVEKIERKGNQLIISVLDAKSNIQDILAKVGVVEKAEYRSSSLQDVFIHFTGHEMRDQESEGGVFQRMVQSRGRK